MDATENQKLAAGAAVGVVIGLAVGVASGDLIFGGSISVALAVAIVAGIMGQAQQ